MDYFNQLPTAHNQRPPKVDELQTPDLKLELNSIGILIIRLNKPEVLNGFSFSMGGQLCDAFVAADLDDRVRCVVLAANGRCFCVGLDFGALGTAESLPEHTLLDETRLYRDVAGRVTLQMRACRKPVIAAIHGDAVGVGITMTLTADIRVAAADAKIGFVFVRRGLVPEGLSSYLLPRLVGLGKSMEWCLTGELFAAKTAAGTGLFNQIVDRPADVLPRALELAEKICTLCSPTMVTLTRAMLWNGLRDQHPETSHSLESRLLAGCFESPDFAEGMASFLERRKPQFPPLATLPAAYPWWQAPATQPLHMPAVVPPRAAKL